MTTAATKDTTVWVYRCSVYAYPWFTSVRTILDDPAYAPWFINFKPVGPWHSPKCDNNYSPPKCSNFYHMQEQSPGYPHGDGDCAAPACDCGNNPCGFYLWNHSSTAVVNGQTFRDWFISSYMFNEVGSSPLVSGCVPRPLGQAVRRGPRRVSATPFYPPLPPTPLPPPPSSPQLLLGRLLAGAERQLPRRERGADRGGHWHDHRRPDLHHRRVRRQHGGAQGRDAVAGQVCVADAVDGRRARRQGLHGARAAGQARLVRAGPARAVLRGQPAAHQPHHDVRLFQPRPLAGQPDAVRGRPDQLSADARRLCVP